MKNTTLCYLEQNGCYLMLHRVKKKQDENAGKWIGIGGKLEENESPEECCCREFLEETGLTLTDYRYRGIITFVSDQWEGEYMHLFSATAAAGTLRDCPEGDLAWVPLGEVPQLPQWEGDRLFLQQLRQNDAFFTMKLCYTGDQLTGAWKNGQPLPLDITRKGNDL